MVVLKIGVLDVQSKCKLGVGSSLPIVWCCANYEVMTKVFLSLSMWVFSYPIWKSFNWFLDFFQRQFSVGGCIFNASEGKRKFRSLLCCHLGPSSPFLLLNFFQKELEQQKRIKRNQQLEAIAKDHYERVLLRKKGLEPWKRLRMQSKQNIQV